MRPHEDAFLEAFDAYADALFKHATMRLSDREKARDATQDTFVRAWDYLAAGHRVRTWKSFLYRVMNNLIIDEYRRAKPLSLDALTELEAPVIPELIAPEGRQEAEEALDSAATIKKIRVLIDELPEPYRGALVLKYVDDLATSEVAEAQGVSENAAAVRIHGALARLKVLCSVHRISP
jgi:RNA polymerase sigma-70 factor (ECF subfamily)